SGGRYREAITGFKELLKREPRPAWRAGLAGAYAGRARELAAKGMLKEALVIWENRAGLGEDIGFEPDHAALLLRMDRVEPVLALFTGEKAMPPAVLDQLRPHLAARVLAGDAGILGRIPADDPLLLHAEAARAAMEAHCNADDAAVEAALRTIPFRSPYRDWVQILKALQRMPERPEEAAKLLNRVGEDSAFFSLRRAAQLALIPEPAFLAAIQGTGRPTALFACALRGWSEARVRLWEEFSRLGPSPGPQTLLRFVYRHRDELGADWVRRRCLPLLIDGFPSSRRWLGAAGAQPVSEEETHLIAAWNAERHGDLWDQQEAWESYARHLMRTLAPDELERDGRLRVALALRRCERTGDLLSQSAPSGDPDELDRLLANQLEESLSWDPDDRGTYLRLIGYYRRGRRLKNVRRLLDQATERWPRDIRVLGVALDTALDTNAFKKAASVAREILALDPINSGVRERLVEAHLAHARKQIIKKRPDLAHKELASAKEWARTEHARDRLDLASGMLALVENPETGGAGLRSIADRLGGGLGAHLALAMTGEAHKFSPQQLFKAIGLGKPPAPARDDLLATLAMLRTHLDGGAKLSRELQAYLTAPLSAAAWTGLTQGETEAACETLRRCGLHKVRHRVARTALKRWKGVPVFELHAFEARHPRSHDGCSNDDISRLEQAVSRAQQEGDTRTAFRIEEILAGLDPFGIGPMPRGRPPVAASVPLPDSAVLAALIETEGLSKALDLMGLPPDIKRDLKAMERQVGLKAVVEELGSFLDMIGDSMPFDAAPPAPRPPQDKPAAARNKKPASRPAGDRDQDEGSPDQMDLF
nr:hypothetical protein [Gammaproteobacteria bacterium]